MSSRRQPESITFFIDRSLGKKLVSESLREAGASVVLHDELFAQDAEDVEWLSVVGSRGWLVLTKDSRIRYRGLEKEAVKQSGARVFIMVSSKLSGNEIAAAFVKALKRIQKFILKTEGPFIAKVYKTGKVSLWTDFSG